MNNLSNIAPRLSKFEKKQIFKAPNNYFDEFPVKLQERISHRKNSKVLKNFFYMLKPKLAMTLLIIIFGTITYFGYKYILSSNIKTLSQQDISTEEIIEIIEYNTFDFEENTFIENLNKSDFIDTSITEEENEFIQYLIDEDIDYSTLLAQL